MNCSAARHFTASAGTASCHAFRVPLRTALVGWLAALLFVGSLGFAPALSAATPDASRRTLVLCGAARATYGLGHELEFLKLQLQRVNTRVDSMPLAELTPERLAEATHLIVFCPEAAPLLTTNLARQLLAAHRPLLWVGYGLGEAEAAALLVGPIKPHPDQSMALTKVSYRGKAWDVAPAGWIPVQAMDHPATRPVMTLAGGGNAGNTPLCWQHGLVTVYSAVPRSGWLSLLFADILLDFYKVTEPDAGRVMLRIDDYQADSDPFEFESKVDLLAARRVPFLVSVTPSWQLSSTGAVATLDSAPEFVASLLYAQSQGGRLLLNGCVRSPAGTAEFWDDELDRPSALAPERVRKQIHDAVALMLKHGLLPIGWHTPQDHASRAVYAEIARVFWMATERLQLSDLTGRETALLSAIGRDREGREIIPENVGFMPGAGTAAGAESEALGALRTRAEFLAALRGTVVSGYFHAYLSQEQLERMLAVLAELKQPFLDVLGRDQWVHIPGQLLLTGRAERKVQLGGGVLTWRAFNRMGRQITSEQETVSPGERVLRRRGKGDYELYVYQEGDRL